MPPDQLEIGTLEGVAEESGRRAGVWYAHGEGQFRRGKVLDRRVVLLRFQKMEQARHPVGKHLVFAGLPLYTIAALQLRRASSLMSSVSLSRAAPACASSNVSFSR